MKATRDENWSTALDLLDRMEFGPAAALLRLAVVERASSRVSPLDVGDLAERARAFWRYVDAKPYLDALDRAVARLAQPSVDVR